MSPLLKEGCLPLLAFCFLFKQIASPFGWPTHFHFGISFPVLLIHSGIGTHTSFFFHKVLLKLCSQRRRKERIERRQCFFCFCFFFCFFRATPAACGSFHSRGQIRAAATGLCHRHSNAGSKMCLRPAPQLTAMPDP